MYVYSLISDWECAHVCRCPWKPALPGDRVKAVASCSTRVLGSKLWFSWVISPSQISWSFKSTPTIMPATGRLSRRSQVQGQPDKRVVLYLKRPALGYVDNTAKQEGSESPTGVLKLLSLVENDKTRFQQIGLGELVQQQNTCLT